MCCDRLLIGAFLAALAVPAGLGLWRADPFPEIKTWRTLPGQCEEWFNAHLGGRKALLKAHGLVKLRGLNVSASGQVILGRDGWLFLDEAKQYGRPDHPAPDPGRQAALWRQSLRRRRDWLAARGVDYLVVLVPEKATVYPEHLPERLRRVPTPSAADRLLVSVPADTFVLDLRGPLLAAKADGPVFFRTDTHWNALGSAVALRELTNALRSRFQTVSSDNSSVMADASLFRRGDLARLLGLGGWLDELAPGAELRSPTTARPISGPVVHRDELRDPPQFRPQLWESGRDDLPDVILLHDSFADPLIPNLAGHCRRLVCLPTWSLDPVAVEHYRPQIVIQELAERALTWRTPPDPAELTTGR